MKLFLAALTLFGSAVSHASPSVKCSVTTGDVDFGDYKIVSQTIVENENPKEITFGASKFQVYVKETAGQGLRISMSSRSEVVSAKEELSISRSDESLGFFTIECK